MSTWERFPAVAINDEWRLLILRREAWIAFAAAYLSGIVGVPGYQQSIAKAMVDKGREDEPVAKAIAEDAALLADAMVVEYLKRCP